MRGERLNMPKKKEVDDLEGIDLDGEVSMKEFLKDNPIKEETKEQTKSFDLDSLPKDFSVNTGQTTTFEPLKAGMYQVEVYNVEIKESPFYKPDAEPAKRGNKYQVSTTFVVLKEGENYGRRFWDNASPSIKPEGKRGATKLYKMVTAILDTAMTWDACASFAPDNQKFGENLTALIGKQVSVAVEIAVSEAGKARNKIVSYFPVETEMPKFVEKKLEK